jgi:hypothetical protein
VADFDLRYSRNGYSGAKRPHAWGAGAITESSFAANLFSFDPGIAVSPMLFFLDRY